MPTYVYQCTEGHVTEQQFKFADVVKEIPCGDEVLINEEDYHVSEHCTLLATRRISNAPMVIINKVMAPPSQRVKNWGS